MDAQNGLINSAELSSPGQDLFGRAVRGGFWVFALRMVTRALEFGQLIVLARVLGVEDIGLLGVAMLCMSILNTFTQTGFRAALIQKKENTQAYLNSAWTVGIIRGIVLFTALYFAAPYAANLRMPEAKIETATAIIQVIGLSFLLEGFVNVGIVFFDKELEFNKLFLYQISGALTNVLVTICVALIYRSVWALVFGKLAGGLVRLILSYTVHPYRPRLSRDLKKAKQLWGFGKWIFASVVLGFLISQGDDIFVWGYLGVASLAFYQMAYKFSNIPATEITTAICWVTFPAYSKLQDDIPRLKDAYLKVLQFTAFLSAPIAGLIFILAPDFVTLFLKEKWLPMVPAMQILAVFGLLRALGATRGPLFRGLGRPWLGAKLKIIKFAVLVILIYPLTKRFGISGTALAVLLQNVIVQPFSTYLAIKVTKSRISEILRPILFPLAATLLMLAVIYLFKCLFFTEITFTSFFIFAIIGVSTYSAAAYIFDKSFNYGIGKVIKEQINTLAKQTAP